MLNQQQSALLNAIFSGESNTVVIQSYVQGYASDNAQSNVENSVESYVESNSQNQGLEIYQHSLIANAARALSITYATVHSYIGKTAFDALVENYLKVEMKKEYDWGEFGFTFAQFISTQTIENAYLLAAIAELDFACHQTERSKDVEVNLNTLNLLSEHDAYELFLTLCAGTQLICSTIPLDEVNNIISELTQANKINKLDDVTQQLTQFSNTYVSDKKSINSTKSNSENKERMLFHFVVWRPDFQATYSQITAEEYQWLSVLLQKKNTKNISIGQALDEVNNEHFSFIEWLPKAIEERLINGITHKVY